MKIKTTSRQLLASALLLGGIAITSSGCVVAPVGPYAYGPTPYYAPAPVVVAPAPVVVFGPWWGGHRHWR